MKIVIDSQVLEKDGFTLQEFAILTYYIGGGKGILNEELCNALWNKGFLVKDVEGYLLDNNKLGKIQQWMADSNLDTSKKSRLEVLAEKMMEVYPSGKKNSTQYWRDSVKIISQRLAVFLKKFEVDPNAYSDEDFVKATEEYVRTFNGEYTYMQLLKYFIFKKNDDGIYESQLINYLSNKGQENTNSWRDNVR